MKPLMFTIILILFMTSCVIPRYADVGYYERHFGVCPEDPEVEHYRAIGKGFNPENCNLIQ